MWKHDGATPADRTDTAVDYDLNTSYSDARMQLPPMFKRTFLAGVLAAFVLLLPTVSPAQSAKSAPSRASTDNPRETPLVRALRKARGTVVNIHSEKTRPADETVFGPVKARKVNGMGTGIIIDARGYIVTNHHVIDGVDSLRVTLSDGGTYTARPVAYDRKHDLAIIKIRTGKSLPVMPMGTSSDLMLGESVVAVGNAFGYENTVTSGIISALSRDVDVNDKQSYKNLIQTDASINPGNSGGPLINMAGEVVGINVAIRAGAQRIGFAIPIDDARRVMAELLSVERLDGNYHGLQLKDVKQGQRRELRVQGTDSGSPAEQAGFQQGDVLIKVAGNRIVDEVDFERSLLGRKRGKPVEVTVKREGKTKTLPLTLARHSGARVVRANNEHHSDRDIASETWTLLGLQLKKVDNPAALAGSRYRGGMRVVKVRPHSPAASNGIRRGDILVGLHIWETVNADNVSYVLNHPRFKTFNPLKFYVVRKGETLFGHLRIGS